MPIDAHFLSAFPKAKQFDLALVIAPLRWAKWSDQKRRKYNRKKIRQEVLSAFAAIQQRCKDLHLPFSTVFRNLVATASADDVFIYRLILEYAVETGRCENEEWMRNVLAFLPDIPVRLLLIHQLLFTNQKPSARAICHFQASYPSTKQKKRFDKALRRIRFRDFTLIEVISELVQAAIHSKATRRDLEKAVFSRDEGGGLPKSLKDGQLEKLISRLPDIQLRKALRYLSLDSERRITFLLTLSCRNRCALVSSLPEEDVQRSMQVLSDRGTGTYLRLFHLGDREWLLETRTMEFWAESLIEKKGRKERHRFIELFKERERDLLVTYMEGIREKEKACAADMASRYIELFSTKELAQRIDHVAQCVPALPLDARLYSKIRDALDLHLERTNADWSAVAYLLIHSPLKVHWMEEERYAQLRRVYQALLSVSKKKSQRSTVRDFNEKRKSLLKAIVTPDLGVVKYILSKGLSTEDLALICTSLSEQGVKVCPPLLDLRNDPGNPTWIGFLKSLNYNKEPIPLVLFNTLKQADKSDLTRAAETYPALFAQQVCKRLTVREIVSLAFKHPVIGVQAERHISQSRRLAELDWVREIWADYPAVQTAYEVALVFSLPDVHFLVDLAYKVEIPEAPTERGKQFDALYRTYRLPKKAGGHRLITVPEDRLKSLQRRLLDKGFSRVRLNSAAKGFRAGQSILTNARPHVGKEMVVNVDIDSFFPSTKYDQIIKASRRLVGGRLSERAIRFVADLCSFNGALPTGAPSSPCIGNIVLDPLDRILTKAAARYKINYTRYADDLTFSGHGDTHQIIPFVERLLAELEFKLDPEKINLFRRGRRQVVTGLVVNEKPNLPRRQRRRLRAAVHHRANGKEPHWHDRPMADDELAGRVAFLKLVQPEEARRYVQMLRSVSPAAKESGS
jgi:retron-type reverse transcriptase